MIFDILTKPVRRTKITSKTSILFFNPNFPSPIDRNYHWCWINLGERF